MSKATVSEVQSLNKRIEEINRLRTRVDTQEEMLRKRLAQQIQEYNDEFGVDLKGKTFAATKRLIQSEAEKVYSEVDKEYELKEKVVSLIERGDIEEANKLLGVAKHEELVEDRDVESYEESSNAETEEDEEDVFGFDDSEFEVVDPPEVKNKQQKSAAKVGAEKGPSRKTVGVKGSSSKLESGKSESGKPESGKPESGMSPMSSIFDDLSFEGTDDLDIPSDEGSDEASFTSSDLEVDDDDFDFGFGEMLNGSKLQV